ncbi:LOW QUALITY PROTEIN: hypothetical protein HID58_056931, partial [Brassica napus]
MENPITVDLLIEIFSRVPLKSIAMFICVSTFLASILRSHDFTELFFNTSLTRPRLLFSFHHKDKHKLFFYSSPQPHNQNVNSSLVATPYHCTSLPNYRPTYISKPVRRGFVILCFDVRSEKFSFINKDEDMLPKPFGFSGPSTLFNYKEKLGIYRQVGQNLVLWVLEDAGNHKWSKHSYVLSPSGYKKYMFVGMTRKSEIVYLCNSWFSYVFLYNIEGNTFRRVNIRGPEGLEPLRIRDTFVDYVENMKFISVFKRLSILDYFDILHLDATLYDD